MSRKNIKYIAEYVCFSLFLAAAKYAETRSGLYCVAVPAVFAALYLKRNALILLPVLVAAGIAVSPSIPSLIAAGSAAAVALILLTVQYFLRKRLPVIAYMIMAAICAVPYFFFGSYVLAAFSAIVSFFAVRAAATLLRFLDFPHPPTADEYPAFLGAGCMAGFVLAHLSFGEFSALPPLFIAVARLLSPSWSALAGAALSAVTGAAFAGENTVITAAVYAFSLLAFNKNSRFGGLAGLALHAACMAVGVLRPEPFSLIAPGVVAIVSAIIPDKKLAKLSLPVFGELLKRSLINKERAAAGKKIAVSRNEITAAVTTADICAIGVMEGAKLGGYRIPVDLSIIGYDNLQLCQYTTPKLTSISQDITRKAIHCTRLLLEKIRRGTTSSPSRIIMGVEIVERQSVISLF